MAQLVEQRALARHAATKARTVLHRHARELAVLGDEPAAKACADAVEALTEVLSATYDGTAGPIACRRGGGS